MRRFRMWVWIFLLFFLVGGYTGCRKVDHGSLSVRIVDGWNDCPIANARVVIPETGDVCMTDTNGQTELLTVPVLYDGHFADILPQDWGTATVLVYADGYYAQAIYDVRIEKNTVRSDLTIRMFPGDGTMGNTPFLLVESPDSDWVFEMLHRYGP